MNDLSITAILFVINAAYYYTFLNAAIYAITKDISKPLSIDNVELVAPKLACGVICLIMTLRFFLGNTKYIADIMKNPAKKAWIKFYHFIVIWAESFILLISSYFIPSRGIFVAITTGLFLAEVVWYALTGVIDSDSVTEEEQIGRPAFFLAQMTNGIFIFGVVLSYLALGVDSPWWIYVVSILFLLNTAFDLHKNIHSYMGVELQSAQSHQIIATSSTLDLGASIREGATALTPVALSELATLAKPRASHAVDHAPAIARQAAQKTRADKSKKQSRKKRR